MSNLAPYGFAFYSFLVALALLILRQSPNKLRDVSKVTSITFFVATLLLGTMSSIQHYFTLQSMKNTVALEELLVSADEQLKWTKENKIGESDPVLAYQVEEGFKNVSEALSSSTAYEEKQVTERQMLVSALIYTFILFLTSLLIFAASNLLKQDEDN